MGLFGKKPETKTQHAELEQRLDEERAPANRSTETRASATRSPEMSRSIAEYLDQLRQGNLVAEATMMMIVSMTNSERAEGERLLGRSDATDVRKIT